MDFVDYIQNFFETIILDGLEKYGRWYSSYRGIVISNEDPEEKGRIVAKCAPVSGDDPLGDWVFPKYGPAGVGHGIFHPPEPGDGVWIEFESGDPAFPVYSGGWWAKEVDEDGSEGDLETPEDAQLDPPTTRTWTTPAGHAISFNDKADEYAVKIQWHDPDADVYSFVNIDKNGSVQAANHQGTMWHLNAKDGEEGVTVIDKHGNTYASDRDGIKMMQKDGTFVNLTEDTVHIVGKNVVVSGEAVNMAVGGVSLGQGATEPLPLGNKLLALWTKAMTAFTAHMHPTSAPGAPTGPPTGLPFPSYTPDTNSLKNKTA
jgi:hypothetical protein